LLACAHSVAEFLRIQLRWVAVPQRGLTPPVASDNNERFAVTGSFNSISISVYFTIVQRITRRFPQHHRQRNQSDNEQQ
jgi:hypothetical protein